MRKLFLCVAGFIGIAFTVTSMAITANDIGVVNFPQVMKTMPAMQAARAKMQKQFAPMRAKVLAQQKNLAGMIQQYKRNSVVMQKTDLQKAQQKILASRTALGKMMQTYQEKMFTAQQSTMKNLVSKVKTAVSEVAKQKKMKLVIMQAASAYNDRSLDITSQVQKMLK